MSNRLTEGKHFLLCKFDLFDKTHKLKFIAFLCKTLMTSLSES